MNRSVLKIIQTISILVMSVLTVILMLTVTKVQGNAKTINYSGIVRGGTQRLVKEELNGMQNDALIVQIDNILYSQMTGSGKFKIPQIPRSRTMGGAGLGLALVREIAHQHGGDVRVAESSSNGTRIELRLLLQ